MPDGSIRTAKIGFIPTVPPLGFSTYIIIKGENLSTTHSLSIHSSNEVGFKQRIIDDFEIQVDPDTAIVTVTKNGRMYLKGNETLSRRRTRQSILSQREFGITQI